MYTICGENGSYKEDEEIEGEIPYDAEVRVFMLNCRINHKADDTTPVPDTNKVFLHNTDDGKTEFQPLWPHIRDNLKTMGRIKDADVGPKFSGMW